jgi:predicted RNase H-like HicB family nuclease
MANNKPSKTVVLGDTVRDIYDKIQDAGTTRADMEQVLDEVAELCVDALPELDEDDALDESASEEEDDE